MYSSVKEIEATDLVNWIADDSNTFKIVDVREMAEIISGTIQDALAMPLATIPLRINDLAKEQKLVIICRSGARSAQACGFLQNQGFDQVYNLRGGMFAWAGTGQPIGLHQQAS